MPVNRRYPLRDLIEACRSYPLAARQRITFEYILLEGINDSLRSAKDLADLLKGVKAKINLIPFNPHEGIRIPAAHGAAAPGLPGSPDQPPLHSHDPPEQRQRHLRRLRPASRPLDRRRALFGQRWKNFREDTDRDIWVLTRKVRGIRWLPEWGTRRL